MADWRELVAALLYQGADAGDWIRDHPEAVSREAAKQAYEAGVAATMERDFAVALACHRAAEELAAASGDVQLSLRATLEGLSIHFGIAEDSDTYLRIREASRETRDVAEQHGAPDVALQASLLAADCSWWAREGLVAPEDIDEDAVERTWTEEPTELDRLLTEVMHDIARVGEISGPQLTTVLVEQLGSLSAVAIKAAMSNVSWRMHEDNLATASAVVDVVRTFVPDDLEFASRGNGAALRSALATGLATLESEAGRTVGADLVRRLETAARLAPDDPGAWATATGALLKFGHQLVDPGELARAAALYVDYVDHREDYRSRLGRLAQAQDTDEIVGSLLADALDRSPAAQVVHDLAELGSARTLLDGLDGLLTTTSDSEAAALERAATDFEPPSEDDVVTRELRLLSHLPIGSAGGLEALEARYAELGAGFSGQAIPEVLAQTQSRLCDDELLLRFVLPMRRSHPSFMPSVVAISRNDAKVVRLPEPQYQAGTGFIGKVAVDGRSPLDFSPLNSWISDARLALQGGEDATEDLHLLHRLLVEPILSAMAGTSYPTWIVVPQRALHLVPWTALVGDDGLWLGERTTVTIAPSASAWARLRDRDSSTSRNLCSFADPLVGYSGLPQLEGALTEAHDIRDAWLESGGTATQREGPDATYPELAELAPGCEVLHIATHGSFPSDAALFDHRLLLGQDLGHAGPVTADDVRRLNLSGVACVVLGICNGGAYRLGPGDEPYGLVPAFLDAGARSVLAAQWPVDDARARDLLAEIGRRLPADSPAHALRESLAARREGERREPEDAALIVIGA